ncbi:MAG TPA: hypothetical protein VMW94_09260 [Actinomycetes bacterium]|nr:hypothetical protein [Actinomycetes bacterium]
MSVATFDRRQLDGVGTGIGHSESLLDHINSIRTLANANETLVAAHHARHDEGGADELTAVPAAAVLGVSAHTVTDLVTYLDTFPAPMRYQGTITLPADFPTLALVEVGDFYTALADVTDNDATKTNTGTVFAAGDEFAWNGVGWDNFGTLRLHAGTHEQGQPDQIASLPTADEKAGLSPHTPTALNPVITEAELERLHDDLGVPATATVAAVHAAHLPSGADVFPGPFTNPDVPRNVAVTFGAGWDGGNIVIDGTDQFGNAAQDTIVANPGAQVLGVVIFATVTAATKGAIGVGAVGSSIDTGDQLGLTRPLAGPVGVLAVDGTTEVGVWDGVYHSVLPTTVANGARQYNAFYPYTF